MAATSTHSMMKMISIILTILLITAFEAEGKKLSYHKHHRRQHSKNLGLSAEWHAWKSVHGKIYGTQREELERHVVWQANKKFIDTHNAFNATFGYTLGMNKFGDLVSEY